MLVYYINKTKLTCPPNKIKYKYLPRSFEQEQDELPRPSNVFSDMFKLPSTWIGYSDINQEEDVESSNSQDLFSSIN